MAKSESTAVNALIDLVRSGKPAGPEAADDLFASPKAGPPRMTGTIPPMRGAGEVEPLPRMRAPTGTSQLNIKKQVRMSTAPPSRATTIPPLPQARGTKAPPPPHRASSPAVAARPSQAMPAQPSAPPPSPALATRASMPAQPSVPPPSPAQPSTAVAARSALADEPPTDKIQPPKAGLPAPVREAAARTTGAQRTALPTTAPVAAPFESNPLVAMPQYPVVARPASKIDQTGDAVSADNWFEASRAVEKIDETWVGTRPAPRRRDAAAAVKKAVVPLVALAAVGFGVGYLVFHTATKHAAKPATTHVAAPAPAPAPQATTSAPAAPSMESANAATATAGGTQPEPPAPGTAPSIGPADPNVPAHPNANEVKVVDTAPSETPAAASAAAPAAAAAAAPAAIAQATDPIVHEVQTARGAVKLVDVRIDSKPAGATVMLVDNGKTTFLGTTPVAASVDPGRSYDIVLTLEGRPTQMAHLDPGKTQRLDVTLGKAPPPAAERAVKTSSAPRAETPHRKAEKHVTASAPTGGLVDPGFDSAPAADAGGAGTLMVSSKPPCEIFIDGKDTGMKTPQRSMSLPAGTHKVTFSNPDANITKTVSVKISADQTTKLIQDLMK